MKSACLLLSLSVVLLASQVAYSQSIFGDNEPILKVYPLKYPVIVPNVPAYAAPNKDCPISAYVYDSKTRKPVVGVNVSLYLRAPGSSKWEKKATATLDASGNVYFKPKFGKVGRWSVGFKCLDSEPVRYVYVSK